MDVDAVSFPSRLLPMLVAISQSDFVSFDLEMSGVTSRIKRRTGGRQTVEERYLEVKEAADKYQVLQVGLTCGRFDHVENHYVLRPFNIALTPRLPEKYGIERVFSFQSGALEFLTEHGFDFQACLVKGMHYLSREEEERIKKLAYDRFDNNHVFQDVHLDASDVKAIAYVAAAREAIAAWVAAPTSFLELDQKGAGAEKRSQAWISNFQKLLIHQLVRAEFPQLVSYGRANRIRVTRCDPVREADIAKRKKQQFKEELVHQVGFRWMVEALARGRLGKFEATYFAKNPTGIAIAADLGNLESKFNKAALRVREHQPVLVGHNMSTDLIYFYRTFFGPLPSTLAEFCEKIHELFPRIVDTKYLATRNCGDIDPNCSLQEIHEQLQSQRLPDIVTHADHAKYHDTHAYHEAGYDSLLTATIMIRLSAKLHAEGAHLPPNASGAPVSREMAENKLPPAMVSKFPTFDVQRQQLLSAQNDVVSDLAAHAAAVLTTTGKKKRRKRGSKGGAGTGKNSEGRFSSSNIWDSLRNLDLEKEAEGPGDELAEGSPIDRLETSLHAQLDETDIVDTPSTNGHPTWEFDEPTNDASDWKPIDAVEREPMELIPDFDNMEFWKLYGNKLRIFGTEEKKLHIAGWK